MLILHTNVNTTITEQPKPRPKGFGFHPLCWVLAWTLATGLYAQDRYLEHAFVGLILSGVYWLVIRPIWCYYWKIITRFLKARTVIHHDHATFHSAGPQPRA
jgi:hypothetical protein